MKIKLNIILMAKVLIIEENYLFIINNKYIIFCIQIY